MRSDGKKGMSYLLDGESPIIKPSGNSNSFLLFSVSLVQVNLSFELFENRIFVRGPSHFHLKFSVRKPNCSNSETFENQGLTVSQLQKQQQRWRLSKEEVISGNALSTKYFFLQFTKRKENTNITELIDSGGNAQVFPQQIFNICRDFL